MAFDEAQLLAAGAIAHPVLRFYAWSVPAATFGYFQKYADVAATTPLRPLIRRPTGGGIVPHDADWTYSFVVPPGHEWHLLKAEESYRRIHEWIRDAFGTLKIKTEVAPTAKKSLPGQCFVGHEKFDLLWQGKKIAGAAQRRNKFGLLIQGSVQPPPVAGSRQKWETAMQHVAAAQFRIRWGTFSTHHDFSICVDELVRTKYGRDDYNRKQ